MKKAAATVAKEPRLDVLINNAGIMIRPMNSPGTASNHSSASTTWGPSPDRPAAAQTAGHSRCRVVSTASIAHKQGKIHFDDINAERGCNP